MMSCFHFPFSKPKGRSKKDGENQKIAIKLEPLTASEKLLVEEIKLYQYLDTRKFRGTF